MKHSPLVVELTGRIQYVLVLGEKWRIIWERRDDDRGECDEAKRTIHLDPERSRCEDLLHEVIHAVEFSLSLDAQKDHEHWVQCVARGLWAVAQDNSWFTSYLDGEAA